ncbi:hypothetical protein DM02DRAFT_652381 [Periconia macrospinosa]|uniref:Uncharacterized protein n=1 Tax=Periconia macrospinosa TaxID=97972 RepID=A0A2V1E0D0_9PLEO|nr:hypothetical protein DM02DRAFT_652381 [Periconia macrospinosa]
MTVRNWWYAKESFFQQHKIVPLCLFELWKAITNYFHDNRTLYALMSCDPRLPVDHLLGSSRAKNQKMKQEQNLENERLASKAITNRHLEIEREKEWIYRELEISDADFIDVVQEEAIIPSKGETLNLWKVEGSMPFDDRNGGSESTKHHEINDIVGWTTSILVAGDLRKDTLNCVPRWKLSRAAVDIKKKDRLVKAFKETSTWGEWRTFNYTEKPMEEKGYTQSIHLVWANLSPEFLTVHIGIEK